jgi:hypothetical protein
MFAGVGPADALHRREGEPEEDLACEKSLVVEGVVNVMMLECDVSRARSRKTRFI